MKKIFIVLMIIFILTIIGIGYIIMQNQIINNNANKINNQFRIDSEIYGADLISLINLAINNNEKFSIKKDSNGIYIEDEKNSIKIDVKFQERDETIKMESIYNSGIEKFAKFYSKSKFKMVEYKYHNKSKKISYIKFEEV